MTVTTTRTVTVICESSWSYQEYPGTVIQVAKDFVTLAFARNSSKNLYEKNFSRYNRREIFPKDFMCLDHDCFDEIGLEFINTLPITTPEQVAFNRRAAGTRSREEIEAEFDRRRQADDTPEGRASDAFAQVHGLEKGPDFKHKAQEPIIDLSWEMVPTDMVVHPLPWSVLGKDFESFGETLREKMQAFNNAFNEKHYIEREGSD